MSISDYFRTSSFKDKRLNFKKLVLSLIVFIWSLPIIGQLSIGGEPMSFISDMNPEVQVMALPPVDVDAAILEDEQNFDPLNPVYRVAIPIEVKYGLDNTGTWETMANGDRVWRLSIQSPGAKWISLLYSKFHMPMGASMYLYNEDRSQLIGGFTYRNNKESRQFATAVIHGDVTYIEYYEPASVSGQGELEISQVGHGYKSFERNFDLNTSGNCQVDINCSPEGDNWQIEKKGVAKILINGSGLCTGSLINNIRQDCRPLFLTADHCLGNNVDAVMSPNAPGWVFYWNFEKPSCDTGDGVTSVDDTQTTSGATLLANTGIEMGPDGMEPTGSGSDFALFLLDENPASQYDVYFNGFDASGATGTGGVGIHHPAGDAKMIATHSLTPVSVVNNNYWRVLPWDVTPNGQSVTEGGSSGSPLFNNSGNIIGQLFGGFAGGQPNCTDPSNDEADYGRLDVSWNWGAIATRRLRDHLDPDNTGDMVVAGRSGSPTEVICPESQTFNLDAACNSPIATVPDFRGLAIITSGSCVDTVTQDPVPGTDLIGDPGDIIDIHIEFLDENDFILDSCNLELTLEDNQAPNIFCPGQQEVVMDDACMGVLPDFTGDALVMDNCEDVPGCVITVAQSPAAGTSVPMGGMVTVTLTATDCNGNSSSCTFDVIGVDETPPVITTPAMNDTVDCDGAGNQAELMAWLDDNAGAEAMDNCTDLADLIWSYEILYIDDGCNNTSATTYRFTVADTSGNEATTDATFVIQDTFPPVIVGGMDTTFLCDQAGAANDAALLSWLNRNGGATATDVCGGNVFWTNDFLADGAALEDCGETGSYSVLFTATDECGNFDTVRFNFTLIDTIAPVFLNCPRVVVVENLEFGLCEAFVNFAPPIALDNCSETTITNISEINPATGMPFESGDRFPLGTTILYYQATDACLNADTCSIKVIVNDVDTEPTINCPEEVLKANDDWLCGAVHTFDPPIVNDVCPDLLITTYQIVVGDDTVQTGLNAPDPDFLYPVGTSRIDFCVQDHPLLLITEVSQDADNLCGGMNPPPASPFPGDDYLEITNFGPVDYEIACLLIEREFGGVIDTFIVPDTTILAPGDVMILQYAQGDVVDPDTSDLFLYRGNSADLGPGDEATYRLSYGGGILTNEIDQITMFADATAGIIRKRIKDSDTPGDFVLADPCMPLTLGMYNPDYPPAYDNGTGITTSLQSVPKHTDNCSVEITVEDEENPFCAEIVDTLMYTSDPFDVTAYECNDIIINVAGGCIMEFIGVSATGLTGGVNALITLTSPEGTIDTLPAGWAGDSLELMTFYGEKSDGDWSLLITPNDKTTFADVMGVTWSLSTTCLDMWMMADTTFNNMPTQCDTIFTWIHPYFLDNCGEGTIEVSYTSDDIDPLLLPDSGPLDPVINGGYGGYEVTETFPVGTTTVKYYLQDAAGNLDSCSFDVTVLDVEDPVVTFCPPDITINLDGGECRRVFEYFPTATDNCEVATIIGVPPSESEFEIGDTKVTVYVTDIHGNIDSSCMFTVTVNEFFPESIDMACNDQVNFSLGGDCMGVLTAEDVLQGTNFRCFENYCMEIEDEGGNIIFSGLLSEMQHTFTEADEGKLFKVSIIDCLGTNYDMDDGEPVNRCWGYVLVEEKLVPEVLCPKDVTILCNESTDPSHTGEGEPATCETDAVITYWDDIQVFEECEEVSAEITRTWFIEDAEGNVGSCEQIITIMRADMEMIMFPGDITYSDPLSCPRNAEDVSPEETGMPTINGLPLNQSGFCNLFVNYTDEVYYGACEGDFDISRTWKVKNTCLPLSDVEPFNPIVQVQTIRVRDNQEPIVQSCPSSLTASVSPWECTATIELPIPDNVFDYCGDVSLIAKIYDGGTLNVTGSIQGGDLKIEAVDVPVGEHLVRYDWTDECNNTERCTFYLTVVDNVKPVAIAKEFTVVSLTDDGDDGLSKIFAHSIDNGSYDWCSDVKIEIRRDGAFKEGATDQDYLNPKDKDDFTCNFGNVDEAAGPYAQYPCGFVGNDTYSDRGHQTIAELDALFGSNKFFDTSPYDCNDDKDEDGGEYIKVCCDDIYAALYDVDGDGELDPGYVKVWLRVWDDANESGYYGDVVGDFPDNYNETWGYVKVEVSAPPTLEVRDVEIACDWPFDEKYEEGYFNSDEFKEEYITATGICHVEVEVTMHSDNRDPVCPDGFVRLLVTATNKDSKGLERTEFLDVHIVNPDGPLRCHDINWPPSYTETNCVDLGGEYELTWDADPCELIGWTVLSDTFEFESDACLKIINNYVVIDWCAFDNWHDGQISEGGNFYSGYFEYESAHDLYDGRLCADPHIPNNEDWDPSENGVFNYVEVIKVVDDIAPVIVDDEDKIINIDGTSCDTPITLTTSATDSSDDSCPTTWFKWEVSVDMNMDGDYDDSGEVFESNIDGSLLRGSELNFTVWRLSGNSRIAWLVEGPMKSFNVLYKVYDGCGNVDKEEITVMVVDDKAPTPYCIHLSTAVMENGSVELWAKDFDIGSFDNCTAITFTFNNEHPVLNDNEDAFLDEDHFFKGDGEVATVEEFNNGDAQFWDASEGTSSKIYDCDELGVNEVFMTVWDSKFNSDFCVVELTIIDNQESCDVQGGLATIAGQVETPYNQTVSEVEVFLEDMNKLEILSSYMTSGDGKFAFASNLMYEDYRLTAIKEDIYTNGVSTLDIVLILRHILGTQPFDNPYKMIAADVNNDKKVSSIDIVTLRKLILGIYEELPDNPSWKFVDGKSEMTMNDVLATYQEEMYINDLEEDMMNEDFVAIKIGDVNGTSVTNARSIVNSTRSDRDIEIGLRNELVRDGDLVDLEFTFNTENIDVFGYQFTLELNGLEYESISSINPDMSEANIGLLEDGIITVSFNSQEAISEGDEMFVLTMRANRDGNIYDMVSLTGSKLNNEGYVGQGLDILDVTLDIEGEFSLFQNQPNPYDNSTTIGFVLPQGNKATLTVYDVTGKVINVFTGDYTQGYNEIIINRGDLNASGLLYYTLQSGHNIATRKMIIID